MFKLLGGTEATNFNNKKIFNTLGSVMMPLSGKLGNVLPD